MATKKHNPGCPCCACKCPGDPGFFSRSFVNTPTVKVVVTGLPATIEHTYVLVRLNSFSFFNTIYRTIYTGLDQFNGTYFFELEKKGKCIVPSSDQEMVEVTIQLQESTTVPLNNPCVQNEPAIQDFVSLSPVSASHSGAGILLPFNDYVSITAQQLAQCRNDYVPVVVDDINNGDILFNKLTNDATICDTRFRASVIDSIETEVIGKITYEMLDLT